MGRWYKIMGKPFASPKAIVEVYANPRLPKTLKAKLGFITPTFMTLFEFFLNDPMSQSYEREIVRRTGVSKGSANKILKELASLNFLVREEKGGLAIYKLNLLEPSVRQFKVLLNTFALKELVTSLKVHSRKIVLFGSCAQGTDVKESDIDLIVLTQEKKAVKKAISQYNRTSKRRIAPIIVEANEFVLLKREDKPLYENIERGITLWQEE